MVSTKAFGMGVDIPDIQLVYHHAPSGLLPDYVQEIGRVARNPKLQGYTALNFDKRDLTYAKALYGMSAIRPYQIQAVMKKVYSLYRKNNDNLFVIFKLIIKFAIILQHEDFSDLIGKRCQPSNKATVDEMRVFHQKN